MSRPALHAAGRHQQMIATNGVTLRTIVEGDGPLAILLHGFPRCWYLWRHQIDPLKAAGFRVAVPDQRGYGASEAPERIDAYNILELTADVIGLADALGEDRFYLVGHDWGCIVAWYTALLYPHRLHCVLGASVPFAHLGPGVINPPGMDEHFWYIRHFQAPGVVEAEFEADIDRTVRFFNGRRNPDAAPAPRPRNAPMFEGDPPPLSDAFSEQDHQYYVDSYRLSGFRGPVSWYRNIARIPTLAPCLEGTRVRVPAYFMAGSEDPVLNFSPGAYDAQDAGFADLRGKTLIDGAGHWLQEEKPAEASRVIVDFLTAMRAEAT